MLGISLSKYTIYTPASYLYQDLAKPYGVTRNHIAVSKKDSKVILLPFEYVCIDEGGRKVIINQNSNSMQVAE